MSTPTKMPSARRVAHEACMVRIHPDDGAILCPRVENGAMIHVEACDNVTAAIIARDAQHTAERDRLQDEVERATDQLRRTERLFDESLTAAVTLRLECNERGAEVERLKGELRNALTVPAGTVRIHVTQEQWAWLQRKGETEAKLREAEAGRDALDADNVSAARCIAAQTRQLEDAESALRTERARALGEATHVADERLSHWREVCSRDAAAKTWDAHNTARRDEAYVIAERIRAIAAKSTEPAPPTTEGQGS